MRERRDILQYLTIYDTCKKQMSTFQIRMSEMWLGTPINFLSF